MWVFRGGGEVGDITFGAYNGFTDSAYGWVSGSPGTLGRPSVAGDVWINYANAEQRAEAYGNTGFQTYIHELGHALGLSHPGGNGDNPATNNQWTVMSYNPHPSQAAIPDAQKVWPITPMMLDIQAIQNLYGVNTATRSGNTTYFGPKVTDSTEVAYQIGDHGRLSNGRPIMMTIWDGRGTDTINAGNQSDAVKIDLNPGHFSSIGTNINGTPLTNNIGIAFAVTVAGVVVNYIENAIGGSKNDTIIGNGVANKLEGGLGIDQLSGWAGNDILLGGPGNDGLNGGVGFDTASYAGINTAVTASLTTNRSSGGGGTDTFISIENLTGGNGNDSLTGNGIANVLLGGIGGDTLVGRGGADRMNGGAGADIFSYLAVSDSLNTARDLIQSFTAEDTINVRAVDAITSTALNDNFRLAPTLSFAQSHAGYFYLGAASGGQRLAYFNTDADTTFEMSIVIQGSVTSGDFVL